MTEEEKQQRSDECTPEQFVAALDSAMVELFSLYSISSRFSKEKLANTVQLTYENTVYGMAVMAEQYAKFIRKNLQRPGNVDMIEVQFDNIRRTDEFKSKD